MNIDRYNEVVVSKHYTREHKNTAAMLRHTTENLNKKLNISAAQLPSLNSKFKQN